MTCPHGAEPHAHSCPPPLWPPPRPLPSPPSAACIAQLDNLPVGDNIIDIQDALYEVTGARSVPRVFVGGKFIGGGDDTAAKAANGELKQLLVAAGACKA